MRLPRRRESGTGRRRDRPGRRFDLEKSRAGGCGPFELCGAVFGVGILGTPVHGEQRPEGAVGSTLRRCRPGRRDSIQGAVHLVSRRPSAHVFRVGRGTPGLDEDSDMLLSRAEKLRRDARRVGGEATPVSNASDQQRLLDVANNLETDARDLEARARREDTTAR